MIYATRQRSLKGKSDLYDGGIITCSEMIQEEV
jgi:hypothetical protein